MKTIIIKNLKYTYNECPDFFNGLFILIVLAILTLPPLIFMIFSLTGTETFPTLVCTGETVCMRDTKIQFGENAYADVKLNFNNRTAPDEMGNWKKKSTFLLIPIAIREFRDFGSEDASHLLEEALHNGQNPDLAGTVALAQYVQRAKEHEVHYSFVDTSGNVTKLDGYCNEDAMNRGTYMEGREICGFGSSFGKSYIDHPRT